MGPPIREVEPNKENRRWAWICHDCGTNQCNKVMTKRSTLKRPFSETGKICDCREDSTTSVGWLPKGYLVVTKDIYL